MHMTLLNYKSILSIEFESKNIIKEFNSIKYYNVYEIKLVWMLIGLVLEMDFIEIKSPSVMCLNRFPFQMCPQAMMNATEPHQL